MTKEFAKGLIIFETDFNTIFEIENDLNYACKIPIRFYL